MQLPDQQEVEYLIADFALRWRVKVQQLVRLRRSKMSQKQMAFLTKRSLKTIQRFENYKCFDPELMFLYVKLLS